MSSFVECTALLSTAGFQNLSWRSHPSKPYFTDEKTNNAERSGNGLRVYSVPGKQKSHSYLWCMQGKSSAADSQIYLDPVFMLSWRLHMFMVFIVHSPWLGMLSHLQTWQILWPWGLSTQLYWLQTIKSAANAPWHLCPSDSWEQASPQRDP